MVPVIWQIWQYQMTRHQTTLGSQDIALLDPERDLSIKVKKCISLRSVYGIRLVMKHRGFGFVCLVGDH